MYHYNHKNTKQRGAAILIAVLFFIMISLIVVIGASTSVTRDYASYREFKASKKSYYLAEAAVEDMMYRNRNGLDLPLFEAPETMSLDGNTVVTVYNGTVDDDIVDSVADANGLVRSMRTSMRLSAPTSFPYGAQIGPGGLEMANSSQITGDVFSSGPIVGVSTGSTITGNVFSTGITPATGVGGSIYGIKNQGTSRMLAETIDSSQVAGKPYCTSAPSSVMGNPTQVSAVCTPLYNLTPSGTLKSFPLSEVQLDGMEEVAEASGILPCIAGKYIVSVNQTITSKKIPCDLIIKSSRTLSIDGTIWVTGTILIEAGASVRTEGVWSYGGSVALIADPGPGVARENGGTIEVQSSVTFSQRFPFPTNSAHVLLISRNTGASVGNGITAIEMKGSSGVVMAYSNYGKINLTNSSAVKNVTGYKVSMKNSSRVDYSNKLQNLFIYGGNSSVRRWSIYDLREVPDP